jgi:hypothetical protein
MVVFRASGRYIQFHHPPIQFILVIRRAYRNVCYIAISSLISGYAWEYNLTAVMALICTRLHDLGNRQPA